MIKDVRILNFDDSVAYQKDFVTKFSPAIVDLKHLNQPARMWASDQTVQDISACLQPSKRHALTFIGSSDYHHVSSILLKQFIHPITLIVFDHRPDWNVFWPKVACNSWISREIETVNVINVIAFGVGKDAMHPPWRIVGNFRAAKGGRLKLYGPYPMPLLPKIMKQIYTEDIYISLDKSCLRESECLSNWESGRMNLATVLQIIDAIGKEKNIIGMDVTGEYSTPVYEHILKKVFAGIARPKDYSARNKSLPEIDAINEDVNIRIATALLAK